MADRYILSSVLSDTTRPGTIQPGLYIIRKLGTMGMGARQVFLSPLKATSTSSFLMRAAGLAEILLFGAVTYHAEVRRGGLLAGIFGRGLAGHVEISRGLTRDPTSRS
jgi:hypothetical protein